MMDTINMAAKPVQISLEQSLLERIDRDPQTKTEGRSAFIRDAVELYLATKRRRDTDTRIIAAYGKDDAARDLQADVELWSKEQVWPKK
ncbi:MAG: hypothetical protein JWO36_4612 [Myxococcales bacterium]|nr:hypothetical protein [Myxococcales bacterium]